MRGLPSAQQRGAGLGIRKLLAKVRKMDKKDDGKKAKIWERLNRDEMHKGVTNQLKKATDLDAAYLYTKEEDYNRGDLEEADGLWYAPTY